MRANHSRPGGAARRSAITVGLAAALASMAAGAFEGFNSEGASINAAVSCHETSFNEGTGPWGDLFSCLGGVARTVKVFVNEEPGTGEVENVKIMWNDHTRDTGYGLHADAGIARAWVGSLAARYAPRQVGAVMDAFFSSRNQVITSERYRLEYAYSRGPSIDERLLLVTER